MKRLRIDARCDTDSTMRHFAYALTVDDTEGDYVRFADAQAEIARLTAESDAALAQVVQAATLPSRYGAARIQTVQRDFNALRAAIRAHDSEAAETAWDRCERWLGLWPLEQTTPPAPAPSTPVDNKISADPVGKEG